jgi:thiamine-phosphate pyrophosphorylase
MFVRKNKYFLIIESIKDIDLKNIKKRGKFSIIYRNKNNLENITDLLNFRRVCRIKSIEFYIANDTRLGVLLNSDGIYISAFNKGFKALSLRKTNFKLIGSAHNLREISLKTKQGCKTILFSKLFLVDYDKNAPFLGIIKFNNYLKIHKNLIPLGGISVNNLNKLNNVSSKGLALLSEVKKKPADIINRLF